MVFLVSTEDSTNELMMWGQPKKPTCTSGGDYRALSLTLSLRTNEQKTSRDQKSSFVLSVFR